MKEQLLFHNKIVEGLYLVILMHKAVLLGNFKLKNTTIHFKLCACNLTSDVT